VKLPAPGEEHGLCGGDDQIACNAGLTCKHLGPTVTKGTCLRTQPNPGEAGGQCGGVLDIPCNAGLTCQAGPVYSTCVAAASH
jgi:hypothetical protein